ncbi:hypothetical protein D9M69_626080 [compost metagenome]
MQTDSFTARCATIGNETALHINDTHIRRAIRNGPVSCWRHFGREIHEHARESDTAPKAEHETPVKHPANKSKKAAAFFGRAT